MIIIIHTVLFIVIQDAPLIGLTFLKKNDIIIAGQSEMTLVWTFLPPNKLLKKGGM